MAEAAHPDGTDEDGPGDASRFVVLLRGMNIGGVRFAMRDLALALTADGFRQVRTVLASGNVVLTAPGADAGQVKTRVEAVIRTRFGFDVTALAVAGEIVRRAVERYPFPTRADRHAYVVFGETAASLAELLESAPALDPVVEQVAAGAGVLYWDAPKGETLQTAFGRGYGRRQRSGAVTTRNRNTLQKILAAL